MVGTLNSNSCWLKDERAVGERISVLYLHCIDIGRVLRCSLGKKCQVLKVLKFNLVQLDTVS